MPSSDPSSRPLQQFRTNNDSRGAQTQRQLVLPETILTHISRGHAFYPILLQGKLRKKNVHAETNYKSVYHPRVIASHGANAEPRTTAGTTRGSVLSPPAEETDLRV